MKHDSRGALVSRTLTLPRATRPLSLADSRVRQKPTSREAKAA